MKPLVIGNNTDFEQLQVEDVLDHNILDYGRQITIEHPYYLRNNIYKGQIHCHSSNSAHGVVDTPVEVVTAYKTAGYGFISLTDYNFITPDPGVSGIEYFPGFEDVDLGDGHLGRIDATNQNGATPQESIDEGLKDSSFVNLCHPNMATGMHGGMYEWDNQELDAFTSYYSVEAYNSICAPGEKNAEAKIDILLSKNRRIFLTAVDDCHDIYGAQFDKAWIQVFANSTSEILDSLKKGNFYASIGATITSIFVTDNIISIVTDVSSTIEFIGQNGTILQTDAATTTANYTVIGNEKYVRIRITRDSDGLMAWTNPFWVSTGWQYTPISGLTPGYIPYSSYSTQLADSTITFDGVIPTFTRGFDGGFSFIVGGTDAAVSNFLFKRMPDLVQGFMFDYQDEFAYLHEKGTNTVVPAADIGTVDNLFLDDASYIQYTSGGSPGVSVVIECVPTTPIINKNNNYYNLGITFRNSGATDNVVTHIKIETWDPIATAYVIEYDEDVTISGTFWDLWLSPRFSPTGTDDIYKLKVTATIPNPLPSNLRFQRLILYHGSSAWDTYHLHIGGGELYGDLTLSGGAILTSSADLVLKPAVTKAIQTTVGGDTRGIYAIDFQSSRAVDSQVASGDYSVIVGGQNNTNSSSFAIIGGGHDNDIATSNHAVIVGGEDNSITGSTHASILGGDSNTITNSTDSVIVGGDGNVIPAACGAYNFIGGGYHNSLVSGTINNRDNIIVGGGDNSIQGKGCVIGGGNNNGITLVSGVQYSVIGGGRDNDLASDYAFIGGGYKNDIAASCEYSSVVSGYDNNITASTYSTISGGRANVIPTGCNDYNFISGGFNNTLVSGTTNNGRNFIGGGLSNSIQGAYCVVVGGNVNTITSASGLLYSTISGGYSNSITVNSSVISGGYDNSITAGGYGTISGGRENTLSSNYGVVVGGRGNNVSGENGVGLGLEAKADKYGQKTQAAGKITVVGDAQTSVLVARKTTTDDTPSELFLDGSSARLVIPINTSWFFTVKVIARQTNDDFSINAYHVEGTISRDAGNAGIDYQATITSNEEDAAWSFTVSADVANQSLKLGIVGAAANNISWVARVELVEVTG